jgi:colicin import membrane protein
MTSKKKTVTKSETFSKEKNEATLKSAANLTIDAAAKKVTEAQLSIGKTLSDVTSKLQEQLQELETVTQAVSLRKQELNTIYGSEQVLKSIDELQAEYENKKTQVDQDFAAYQQETEARQQSLELQRTQEEESFNYNLQQARRNEQLKYEEENRVRKAYERDQTETLQKGWALREEGLKKLENEIVDLRAKVAAFPTELDAAVKKAEAIVGNTVKRDYEHKLQLLQKDFDTAKTVSDGTIRGLHERLAANDKVIGELTLRLTSAEERVTTIATKALEAASSTKSLADVQNLIQTQNNGASARKT